LIEDNKIGDKSSMLLVVGRYDTGQLEAQVRGSRYAWDMRLISVDWLLHLVNLKENTEDEVTSAKIRTVLIPMEYTRLDTLVDVMFATAKDVEKTSTIEPVYDDDKAESKEKKYTFDFTDTAVLDRKREKILNAVGTAHGVKLIKKSRAMYWSSDREFRVASTISKRYEKGGWQSYWYAYHPSWQEFLSKATKGFFVLGCMDLNIAFAIPFDVIESKVGEFNTTTKVDGSIYWHIFIRENGLHKYLLVGSKTGDHLDLTPFVVNVETKEING
jgi:hypothetical protein